MTMTVPSDSHNTPPVQVTISPEVLGLRVGVVVASGIQIGLSSPALQPWCTARIADVLRQGMAGGEPRREAIRKMLRAGGFKPAGRNKPAQEYLFRTVSETGSLPAILNAVDVLNVVSLQSGLPISLLAADRIGSQAVVRYGQPAERFVFNRSGQELDIEGLICVCGGSFPLGTPIKDSMLGKVTEANSEVLAILYAPAVSISSEELAHWTSELAAGFRDWCGATEVREWIV